MTAETETSRPARSLPTAPPDGLIAAVLIPAALARA